MKEKNKVIALAMVVLILATLFLSYDFILENTHHNCTGEECPICMQLEVALQLISNFKWIPVVPFMLLTAWLFIKFYVSVKQNGYIKKTLISLRVELLD